PNFPIYLLSGLLAWNLFSVSLTGGARTVIDNANLVKKVSFPREVLPLSAVGVALVDFVLQSAVFLLYIVVSGYGFHLPELVIYPLAFATLLVFTLALTFWLAALNVRYRDIQHLLNVALLVWFWMTPIVYSAFKVQEVLAGRKILGVSLWGLYQANPLASIAMGFQRALYGVIRPVGSDQVLPEVSLAWLAGVLAIVLAASVAFLLYTWRRFFDLSGDFAEEL
ncbi:MAG: ABC transporter permease, partial [Actinomycetota bacterium]